MIDARVINMEIFQKYRKQAIKMIILLVAVVILLMSCSTIFADKWVFIGDSYASLGKTYNVPDLIAKSMNVKSYKKFCVGGFGVAAGEGKSKDRRFIKLLKGEARDPRVKVVMIIGGINNDRKETKSKIMSEADKLFARIHQLYKNARIYYCIPNWCSNTFKNYKMRQDKIVKRLKWYKKACEKNGGTFLTQASNVLHTKKDSRYFTKDGHHPSIKGKILIAETIVKWIKKDQQNRASYTTGSMSTKTIG